MLGRPLGLQRRDGKLHVVLVDRRRPTSASHAPTLTQLRTELRERLLAHSDEQAAQVMRHLVFVHDTLRRKGWPGVELLPARVLGFALAQTQMLTSEQASPTLSWLIERLHILKVAGELREERLAQARGESNRVHLEVSESTPEAFEEVERSWVGTIPPGQLPRDEKV